MTTDQPGTAAAAAPRAPPVRHDLTDGVVLLRAPVETDVPALVAGCSDPEVGRWTCAIPIPYTDADARWYVAHTLAAWAEATAANFAVAAADEPDRLLGACGVHGLDLAGEPGGTGEIGYWLAPAGRGRGLMTRAVRLVSDWAFAEAGLVRLSWYAVAGNEASLAVAERAGFRLEGTARRGLNHRGTRVDGWVAGLLPEDRRAADRSAAAASAQ